jgi:hypothetical protein
VQKAALVETQQPATVAANQNSSPKNLVSSFRKSFISSGKQGDGATVLGERPSIAFIKHFCSLAIIFDLRIRVLCY